jgi:hypothetical protein
VGSCLKIGDGSRCLNKFGTKFGNREKSDFGKESLRAKAKSHVTFRLTAITRISVEYIGHSHNTNDYDYSQLLFDSQQVTSSCLNTLVKAVSFSRDFLPNPYGAFAYHKVSYIARPMTCDCKKKTGEVH